MPVLFPIIHPPSPKIQKIRGIWLMFLGLFWWKCRLPAFFLPRFLSFRVHKKTGRLLLRSALRHGSASASAPALSRSPKGPGPAEDALSGKEPQSAKPSGFIPSQSCLSLLAPPISPPSTEKRRSACAAFSLKRGSPPFSAGILTPDVRTQGRMGCCAEIPAFQIGPFLFSGGPFRKKYVSVLKKIAVLF